MPKFRNHAQCDRPQNTAIEVNEISLLIKKFTNIFVQFTIKFPENNDNNCLNSTLVAQRYKMECEHNNFDQSV